VTGCTGRRSHERAAAQPGRQPPLGSILQPESGVTPEASSYSDPTGRRLSQRNSGECGTGGRQAPTNGRAGGKLPAGKIAARSPARSFSAGMFTWHLSWQESHHPAG
jgi:hypothetical protein